MAGARLRTLRHAILTGALLIAGGASPVAYLDVTVSNVRNDQGHVLVAVCPEPEFLSQHCPFVGKASAQPGAVTVRVAGIPPGIYAVQAFHDENDNKIIDRNLLGIPKEGLGFSNDAPFRFGPPRFRDAALTIGPGGGRVTIRLRYFLD